MRTLNKVLAEANRTPESVYYNSRITAVEALRKLERKYGIEYVHSRKELEAVGLEPLTHKGTYDFYVKANGGYYRICKDSDGHAEFKAGKEDPETLKLLTKIYTMHFGYTRSFDAAKVPDMGKKALKARLAHKKLVQALFGDLSNKYDFEIGQLDVDYHECDSLDDDYGTDTYYWTDEGNYVKVMEKDNPENYVVFAPNSELAATKSVHLIYYSPAHLTADPYYSSPEESEYEYGDAEPENWKIEDVDYAGDISFLDEDDKQTIISAFDKYLLDFVENL